MRTNCSRLRDLSIGDEFFIASFMSHNWKCVISREEFEEARPDWELHPGWVPHKCSCCGEIGQENGILIVHRKKENEWTSSSTEQ